jgi:hypothetical protein
LERRRPPLQQEQRLSPGDFVRGFIYSRASAENPVLSQATVVISYPVGRLPLFAAAIPNAYLTKIVLVPDRKRNFAKIGSLTFCCSALLALTAPFPIGKYQRPAQGTTAAKQELSVDLSFHSLSGETFGRYVGGTRLA